MDIKKYTEWARSTAIYPGALDGKTPEISYLTLGLANEAGEVAGVIKKLVRDENAIIDSSVYQKRRDKVKAELGDVFWYLVRLSDAFGLEVEDILEANVEKLKSRKERGVLQGSGDNR